LLGRIDGGAADEDGEAREDLRWAIAGADAEAAIRLAGALLLLWHNHMAEGARWLEQALRLRSAAPLDAVARALTSASRIALFSAGLAAVAAACGDGDRALRLWAAVEDLEDLLGAPLVENERRRYERYVLPHRKDAGPAAAHGSADTLEATIEFALNEGGVPRPNGL
jgi:hypothetical protein